MSTRRPRSKYAIAARPREQHPTVGETRQLLILRDHRHLDPDQLKRRRRPCQKQAQGGRADAPDRAPGDAGRSDLAAMAVPVQREHVDRAKQIIGLHIGDHEVNAAALGRANRRPLKPAAQFLHARVLLAAQHHTERQVIHKSLQPRRAR